MFINRSGFQKSPSKSLSSGGRLIKRCRAIDFDRAASDATTRAQLVVAAPFVEFAVAWIEC
jgi:hypothetical protein